MFLINYLQDVLSQTVLNNIIQAFLIPFIAGVFFLIFISLYKNFKFKLVKYFVAAIITSLLLIVADAFEYYYSTFDYPTKLRMFFAASAYSLRPLIIFFTLQIFYVEAKPITRILFILPCVFNTIFSFLAFKLPSVFYYTSDNSIVRGPLISIPFIVSIMYFIFFFSHTKYKNRRGFKTEIILVLVMFVVNIVTTLLEMLCRFKGLLTGSAIISTIIYYLYCVVHNYSIDHLTGAYVRFKLYEDIENNKNYSLIAFDINSLKKLNDNQGHEAGDECIKKIFNIFTNLLPQFTKIYRMGGDEFVAIIKNTHIDKIMEISNLFKRDVEEIGYSISLGYSIKENNEKFDDLLSQAEIMLNQDKKYYHGV